MPHLSRWMVRLSLFYLALGATFGALMLVNKAVILDARLWWLLNAHVELMFFGWMTQFAMGIAFWILPRFATKTPRGNEGLIWLAFGLFNFGIGLSGFSSWMPFEYVATGGKGLLLFAWLIFLWGVWRRIYPFGASRKN